MQVIDNVLLNKLVSASYWLGRAVESFDQEDFSGSEYCLKFFRNFNNYLLRYNAQNSLSAIQDIQVQYNDLVDLLAEVKTCS